MKKTTKILIAGLCSAALLGGAGYALTSEDSLVTLSYVKEQFVPAAEKRGSKAAEQKLQETYDGEKSRLDQVQGDLRNMVGQSGNPSGSGVLTPMDCTADQVFQLPVGSSVLMQQGTAVVEHDGAFIDATTGRELADGGRLEFGHRYLVGENTTAKVKVMSGAARLGIQGEYQCIAEGKARMPFYDVSRLDEYFEQIAYCYENGYFVGISPNEFGPDVKMDRSMVMTVFYKVAGQPKEEMDAAAHHHFSDVPENMWYAPFVKWGFDRKITGGTGPHTFHPEELITQEQFVQLLYNFAVHYLGEDLTERTDLSGYRDLDEVSGWAADAMSWGVAIGLIEPGSDMKLNPQHNNSRAEIAKMLYTFENKVG